MRLVNQIFSFPIFLTQNCEYYKFTLNVMDEVHLSQNIVQFFLLSIRYEFIQQFCFSCYEWCFIAIDK